jgi:DNA-binding MarR family transcriptional regulator
MPPVKHKNAKLKKRAAQKRSRLTFDRTAAISGDAPSVAAQFDSLPSSATAAQVGHLASPQAANSPGIEKASLAEPTPPPALTAVDIADQLHSAAIHLLRRLGIRDRESGIGPAQLSALSVLVFGGPRSLGELADTEQVRPPTMSRIVAGLQRSGLVRRHATEDGRRVRLEATPKGVSLMWGARKRRVESLANAVAGLLENELRQLREALTLLQQVTRNL